MTPASVGRLGEVLAARFLESRGGVVVDRNRRVGRHEVDLVVEMDGMRVAVEVKTRRASVHIDPTERIDDEKMESLYAAAAELKCGRIDSVGVTIAPSGVRVRWFQDVG
ncbi:MAG: YraN family protein [Acidimicrobiia bacterium]|nr:YraN family protein [Acidimicrobiia bacterium]